MYIMSSVKIERPLSNNLELNIIKLHSPYSERAITSHVSAVIDRRDFTHISPYVSLKIYSYTFYILIIT